MSNHTLEPWKQAGFSISAKGGHVAKVLDVYMDRSIRDANGRRIVACVNACAGIPTENLEGVNLRDKILEYSETMLNAAGQGAKVTQQRDVLLAALREIAESYPVTDEGFTLASIAREALK